MKVYADTSWWVALKNQGDRFHRQALQVLDREDLEIHWTPWQRLEVFNSFRQLESLGKTLEGVSAKDLIRALEEEVRLGYWPHAEFDWTGVLRIANELSFEHSRRLVIRGMDLMHVAIALELAANTFLTFDKEQAELARAAGVPLFRWK